jgi:fatty-acyl-CoA synthase
MPVPRHYDWISHHAERRPSETAAVDLAGGRRFSYADFDKRIAHLAGHLRDICGVGRGERVATLLHNTTDVFEIQFACGRLGAIFVPLNWRLAVPELEFIVGDATPRVLIHDLEFAETTAALRRSCDVPHAIAHGDADSPYERAISAARPLVAPETLTHDDLSTIMYTSGTTGRPKGAMITHGMTFWNAVNLGAPHLVSHRTIALAVLPLFHTGGLNCYANPVFHAGGTVLVMRSFDPAESLRLIGDPAIGLTHFFGVPANYQFMAQHPTFAETDFTRLLTAGVGGAPTPVALLRTYEARGIALVQGYGMTETSPAVLALTAEEASSRAGSAGKPVLHGEVRIVREDGSDAASGEIGELWVRGALVTPGYWNRTEANKSSFTDGWLHTGDAARTDADGFYYIVDRWKDMYISGGENVYPAEVENVLYQLPAIAEVAVIGVPDERWGEVGRAVIVVKPGHTLTEGEIMRHCEANLARYKLPRSIIFTDLLPRNATGKVHKPSLRMSFGGGAPAPAAARSA